MNEIGKALSELKGLLSAGISGLDLEMFGMVSEDSFRLAISALEKQIPKKVKGLSQTHEGYVGNCPYCGKFITRRESKRVCGYENCLQRLDWSVEE